MAVICDLNISEIRQEDDLLESDDDRDVKRKFWQKMRLTIPIAPPALIHFGLSKRYPADLSSTHQ